MVLDGLQMLAGGLQLRFDALGAAAVGAAAFRIGAVLVRSAFVFADVDGRALGAGWHEERTLAGFARKARRHGRTVFAVARNVYGPTLLVVGAGDAVARVTAFARWTSRCRIEHESVVTAHAAGDVQTFERFPKAI